jgi:hypothetical protein
MQLLQVNVQASAAAPGDPGVFGVEVDSSISYPQEKERKV